MEHEKSIINDSLQRLFHMRDCYKSDTFVFTFDSAFESNFKCTNCGKNLNRMNKEEVSTLTSAKEPKVYSTVGPAEVKKPV